MLAKFSSRHNCSSKLSTMNCKSRKGYFTIFNCRQVLVGFLTHTVCSFVLYFITVSDLTLHMVSCIAFVPCYTGRPIINCLQLATSRQILSTPCPEKRGHVIFNYNSRISGSIFIIFVPFKTGMNTLQIYIIYLLKCLMTS